MMIATNSVIGNVNMRMMVCGVQTQSASVVSNDGITDLNSGNFERRGTALNAVAMTRRSALRDQHRAPANCASAWSHRVSASYPLRPHAAVRKTGADTRSSLHGMRCGMACGDQ